MSIHEFYSSACVAKPVKGEHAAKYVVADAEWYAGMKEKPTFVPFPAWNVIGTDPRIEPLLMSSFAMYQVFTSHYAAMQKLLAYMDGLRIAEGDPIRTELEHLCNSTLLIQQAARDGLDEVARQITNERASRGKS